jgi:hypothetical protein
MVERPPAADDDTRPMRSQMTKPIIGALVFVLGVFVGAAIAAWIMPPF